MNKTERMKFKIINEVEINIKGNYEMRLKSK